MDRLELAKRILKRGYFVNLPIVDNSVDSETILWRTVLDYALIDLLRGPDWFRDDSNPPSNSEFMETSIPLSVTTSAYMGPVTFDSLLDWFSVSCEDFITVCELAGLPPHGVYMKMSEMLYD